MLRALLAFTIGQNLSEQFMRVTTPLAVLVSIATSTAALADTINVPADQPTIQAAIDFAVDGDVVLVYLCREHQLLGQKHCCGELRRGGDDHH